MRNSCTLSSPSVLISASGALRFDVFVVAVSAGGVGVGSLLEASSRCQQGLTRTRIRKKKRTRMKKQKRKKKRMTKNEGVG